MDCQTFDASLLDALYGELDAGMSGAMDEHAARCEACAGRRTRLRETREVVGPALEVQLPDDLEGRILAATAAAMDVGNAPAASVPIDDKAYERERGAPRGEVVPIGRRTKRGGLVAFFARPELAVAATFVLVLGAVAFLVNTRSKDEPAPAAVAQSPAPPAAEDARERMAGATATVAASTLAYATAPPAAAPVPTPAGPHDDLDGVAAKTAAAGGGAHAHSAAKAASEQRAPAFAAAMALYDAGRYAEALPRFQALASSHPEAEIYAARCIANTRGCGPAVAHFDTAAKRNAGTEGGSRAALEAARCATRAGETTDARARYQNLTSDHHVGSEAAAELARLESPHAPAAVKAGKPAATATTTAIPKAAPPPEGRDSIQR